MNKIPVILLALALLTLIPANVEGERIVTIKCQFMGDDGDWIWVDATFGYVTIPFVGSVYVPKSVDHDSRTCNIG